MRRIITIGLLMLALMTGTGCMRIASETGSPAPHPTQRFYSGTKLLFGMPRNIALGLGVASVGRIGSSSTSDVLGGIFIGLPIAAVFATAFIVDIPLEFGTDTLLLPVDGIIYARHCLNPPLDKYLYDNNVEGMKSALEKGADPNAIHSLFIEKELVIETAFKEKNEAIFELLLEHGAKVPFSILNESNIYLYKMQKDNKHVIDLNARKEASSSYRMLCMVFNNGCPKEFLENEMANSLVSRWIEFNLGDWHEPQQDAESLVDILTLLMENGFPPVCEEKESRIHGNRTSLDVVLDNAAMQTSAKDRLVAAMRAHGAKRYCELHNQEPPSGHLNTDGLKIDAMFQPVVDILKQSQSAGLFTLNDSYPDVEGPVLVIDKPLVAKENVFIPQHKRTLHYRRNIRIRRRISETEWSHETDTLDVPAKYRIVLTPTGKRLPSRRPKGMPTEQGFWEAWYTLPTCELYVEHTMSCGEFPDWDLLSICLLPMKLDDNRELVRLILFEPEKVDKSIMDSLKWPAARKYNESNMLDDLVWTYTRTYSLSDEERKWLSKSVNSLAQIGITAEWRVLESNYKYAFSTHRDLSKVTADDLPLALRPDEIVAFIVPDDSALNQSLSHDGKNYWNRTSRPYDFPSHGFLRKHKRHWKGGIHLYYGDAVTEKRIEEVFKAIEKLQY